MHLASETQTFFITLQLLFCCSLCYDNHVLFHPCDFRDGGLKRAKVKETFKEEQQKLYSKVLVGEQVDQTEDKLGEDEDVKAAQIQ